MFWLQTPAGEIALPTPKPVELTLWDFIVMGGWAMVPIILLAAIGLYIFLERYLLIAKYDKDPSAFMEQVKSAIRQGDVRKAEALCMATATPFARMVGKGISRLGSPLPDIAAAIQNQGNLEILQLEKNIPYLATISALSPMLGFLGTVTGLIQAFMKIAHLQGNVNPAVLADGIYEAMITTAAGLIVAIPMHFAYNVLVNRIQSFILKMEAVSMGFLDVLQEPVR
ncbi:MAG: MotA/TolQ/ExbB proton channel family protein [Bacteroidia bacterium]|jgi:biopolymer transport protein ExbB|nr:MotA/TolQ/ExbB proton channel family protein [Bacteroidia bacterium]GIV24169.1 MAG: biopolymer transporter ExbB [Bacteroidia bacterium]